MLAALIPAAGASSRMRGRDKLLEPVDQAGTPALRAAAEAALAVADAVLIALPAAPESPRWAALEDLEQITRIAVPDATEGMGASLRALASALPEGTTGALIHMPDMPDLGATELRAVASAFSKNDPNALVQATTGNGLPGHPILFGRAYFDALAALTGDRGAYRVVQEFEDRRTLVPLPGDAARRDLDTPEDWAAWRADRP